MLPFKERLCARFSLQLEPVLLLIYRERDTFLEQKLQRIMKHIFKLCHVIWYTYTEVWGSHTTRKCHPRCVCETRRRYVVNLITEVYLMTVMETTTCFGLYWPSSGCLGNLRASYMDARKPATKPLGAARTNPPSPPHTTQHFQGGGQRTSLRTTTTPHLPRTTPHPPFHKLELLSSLYFMYFVVLPVAVMFHSVLSDPCFDWVCQTMRM